MSNEKQQLNVPLGPVTIGILQSFLNDNTIAGSGIVLSISGGKLEISSSSSSAVGRSHNPTLTNIPVNSGLTPFTVGFQTNDFANGITWDATNKQFICTVAGKYEIYLQISYAMPSGSFSGASSFYALIYLNGVEVSRGSQIPGAGLQPVGINVSNVLNLAVGDAVNFYAMTDHPQSVNIEAASNLTYAYIK